jgi:hypothetical protein
LSRLRMRWHQTRVRVQLRGGSLWLKTPSWGETRQLTSDRYCLTYSLTQRSRSEAEKYCLLHSWLSDPKALIVQKHQKVSLLYRCGNYCAIIVRTSRVTLLWNTRYGLPFAATHWHLSMQWSNDLFISSDGMSWKIVRISLCSCSSSLMPMPCSLCLKTQNKWKCAIARPCE